MAAAANRSQCRGRRRSCPGRSDARMSGIFGARGMVGALRVASGDHPVSALRASKSGRPH
jgi:hypothetical protein